MKITVESSPQIVNIDTGGFSVPGRVWEGFTDGGIAVQVIITLIAVHKDDDNSQFKRELIETQMKPTTFTAFPARMIL